MSTASPDTAIVLFLILGFIGVAIWLIRRTPNANDPPQLAEARKKYDEARQGGGIFSASGRMTRGPWFVLHLFAPILGILIGTVLLSVASGLGLGRIAAAVEYGDIAQLFMNLIDFAPVATMLFAIGTFTGGLIAWLADIRRLHDMGKTGWYSLIRLVTAIPFVGILIYILYFLWLLISDGEQWTNEYGPDPSSRPSVEPRRYIKGVTHEERAIPRTAPAPPVAPVPQTADRSPVDQWLNPDPALSIVKDRLAKGEITADEFKEIKEALDGS